METAAIYSKSFKKSRSKVFQTEQPELVGIFYLNLSVLGFPICKTAILIK